MKKILLFVVILGAAAASYATVTINFTVGILSDGSGTPIPDGSLIQIIGSPSIDNTFDAPTAGAFIGGNDTLIYSWSFDSGTTGDSGAALFPLVATIPVNTNLLLRWFPTLTTASLTPGASTAYGQYGSLTDVSWVAPADGSGAVGINFVTVSWGGSAPDLTGYANLTTAAIPEPSAYAAIFGALALGFVAYRRRQQAA